MSTTVPSDDGFTHWVFDQGILIGEMAHVERLDSNVWRGVVRFFPYGSTTRGRVFAPAFRHNLDLDMLAAEGVSDRVLFGSVVLPKEACRRVKRPLNS